MGLKKISLAFVCYPINAQRIYLRFEKSFSVFFVVRKPVSLSTQLFYFNSADRDFEPPCEEEDDEETIEVEEQQEGNDAESHRREIELLKEEGNLPLDQLLSTLKLPQVPQQIQ